MTDSIHSSLTHSQMLFDAGKPREALAELARFEDGKIASLDYVRLKADCLLRLGLLEDLGVHLDSLDNSNPQFAAAAALYRARQSLRLGNHDQALREVAHHALSGSPSLDGDMQQLKASCEVRLGDLASAQSSLKAAIASHEVAMDKKQIAESLSVLGVIERKLGNISMAIACLERAKTLAATLGACALEARACQNLGTVHLFQGRLNRAAAEFDRSLVLSRESELGTMEALAELALGLTFCRRGLHIDSKRHLCRGWKTSSRRGWRRQQAMAYEYLAEFRLSLGEFARARRLLRRAMESGRATGQPEAQFEPQYRLAEAELGLLNPSLARQLAVAARDDFAARGDRLEAAFASRVAAQALLCLERWDEAEAELAVVHATLEEMGEQFEIQRVRRLQDAARDNRVVFDIRLAERQARMPAPVTPSAVGEAAQRPKSRTKAHKANDPLPEPVLIYGKSRRFLDFLKEVDLHAHANIPILLEGETGVGKELIARRIHANSPRSGSDLVPFNCGTSTPDLFDSELFGYVRGAFTGADSGRRGLARAADAGSLLLDEIGELTKESQARLLRFLDTGEVRPVGSDRIERTDTRIISATHQNLDELVATGRFRRDLFFRLNTIRLRVPPLRERLEDLELLLHHFFELAAQHGIGEVKGVSGSVITEMMSHLWPGNVRELRNEAFRLVRHYEGKTVRSWRPREARAVAPKLELDGDLPQAIVESALRQTSGSPTAAARLLAVNRGVIYRLIKSYGLNLDSYRS